VATDTLGDAAGLSDELGLDEDFARGQQRLTIRVESRRYGKPVTVVSGFDRTSPTGATCRNWPPNSSVRSVRAAPSATVPSKSRATTPPGYPISSASTASTSPDTVARSHLPVITDPVRTSTNTSVRTTV
jgi:hypothetical protein